MDDVSFCDILCQICNCESKCNFEKQEDGRGRLLYFLQNDSKGHLISKCPFGVFKSPKKTTKFFPGFQP